MASKPNEIEGASDSDRADDEVAAIALERVRTGAAEEREDGTEAFESLGMSVSAEAVLECLEHRPATLTEFEAAHWIVRAPDGDEELSQGLRRALDRWRR